MPHCDCLKSIIKGESGYPIPDFDYLVLMTQAGLIHSLKLETVKGKNPAVGTTLASLSGSGEYRTPSSAVELEFISSDVNDSSSGSGAQEITVVYLDSNFDEQTQTIELNGTNVATTTVTDVMRLLKMRVSRSGSYANQTTSSHAGEITARVAGAGNTWSNIVQYNSTGMYMGEALIGGYTIPRGKTGFLVSSMVAVDSGKTADYIHAIRNNADDNASPYTGILRFKDSLIGVQGVNQVNYKGLKILEEKSDLFMLSKVDSTVADVSAELDIIIVNS